MKIILLSQDLMIGARLEGAARHHGLSMLTVRDQQTAVAAASDEDYRVLLIDLRTPGIDVEAFVSAIRECREQHLPIVACGPHVHEAKLAKARAAGCDAVVTRGQFDREAEAILGEMMKSE